MAIPAFDLTVAANRTTGIAGTTFTFSATSVSGRPPIRYEWGLPDGSSRTGDTVSVTLEELGSVITSVVAIDADGKRVEGEALATVLPSTGRSDRGLLGVVRALLPGDVDDDGTLELQDALSCARLVARQVVPTNGAQRLRADAQPDGVLTGADVDFIAGALDSGAGVAEALTPSRGAPGRVVLVTAPALLDGAATFVARVGGGTAVPVDRVELGRGAFVVLPGTPAGRTEVRLESDDGSFTTFDFEVLPPYQSAEPPGALLARLDALAAAGRPKVRDGLVAYLDQVLPEPTDRALLLGIFDAMEARAEAARDVVRSIMAQVPADLLLQLEAIAVANGLLEQIALGEQLQAGVAAAGTSPLLLTDTALAGFCWLSAYKSSAVGGFGSFTSTACDYGGNAAAILLLVASVATAGTFSPAAIAILTGIVSGCAFVAAPVAISEVVTEFAPDLKQARLALTATPAVLVPPQLTSELRVSLNVPINPELVNGAESIRDKILRKAVDKLLSKTPVIGALKRAIRILPEDIRKEIEDRILGVASSAVGSALDQTQLGARFDQISAYLVAIGSAYGVTLDPNGVLDGPTPAVGVLQLAPPGTEDPSIYTGDAAQPATVTFTAAKVICGMPLSASAQVSYGVRPVVITMGDNGALLDDIFLVEVDGQTVLTSQVPVTQTSTTVELTLGDHVAIMRGLAAPDGIGTYYILFNGATVLPGSSATSGSNLVPGTFKTFNIRVQ